MAEAHTPEKTEFDIDTTNHSRGLWLLKVPKYLSEQWSSLENGTDIGSIEFVKKPSSSAQNIVFRVSQDSVKSADGHSDIPLTHNLKLSSSDQLSMLVFSKSKDEVKIEGKIAQKADIQVESSYIKQYMLMKRKKLEIIEAEKKAKYDKAPITSFPNKLPHANIRHKEIMKQKRERQEDKHLRSDKQTVLDSIFDAFRKHQFYSTNDLVSITKQPQNHLKDILKGVCIYRTHAPNKNTWELKPEYKEVEKEDRSTLSGDDDDDDIDDIL